MTKYSMSNVQLKKDFEELFSGDDNWIRFLENKVVFITGATGLIGSVLAKSILYYNDRFNHNIKVVCAARNVDKINALYSDYLDIPEFESCIWDVNEPLEYNKHIDYIVHCANTTSSKEYIEKPVETIRTIVRGTENTLELAKEKQIKSMVYLSSMETYGIVLSNNNKITESDYGYIDTGKVRSSYPEGKRLAECLCASYAAEYDVNVVIARLAQVFGAGINKSDDRIFMQLARSVMEHKDFIMRSDGSSYGNYCYSTDAVKAIIMLLGKGETGGIYNVVNENNTMTIREMSEMVAQKLADDSFNIIYDVSESGEALKYAPKTAMRLSAEKLNKLGWKANIELEEMYRRMINSLKDCD